MRLASGRMRVALTWFELSQWGSHCQVALACDATRTMGDAGRIRSSESCYLVWICPISPDSCKVRTKTQQYHILEIINVKCTNCWFKTRILARKKVEIIDMIWSYQIPPSLNLACPQAMIKLWYQIWTLNASKILSVKNIWSALIKNLSKPFGTIRLSYSILIHLTI